MRRRAAGRIASVIVGIGLLLSGCTPAYQPMGLPATQPALADRALIAAAGFELPLRRWLPEAGGPQAVVLALHGYNDYSNAFDGAGRSLAARGIAVYAYDQRGFGAT